MSTRGLFLASVFVLATFIISCNAQNVSQCVPSSCGDVRKITFPFRLKTDPRHCGELGYELDCHNNQTIYSYKSRKFYVQEINYRSFSIRLLDPGLKQQKETCSVFPNYRASYDALTSEILQWLSVDTDINYVSCLAPIQSSQYIPTSFCSTNRTSSSNSSYLVIGEILRDSDLANGCRVQIVAWSSAPGISSNRSSSLSSTHQALAHGFELSWKRNLLCRECEASRGTCILEDNTDEATCRHYCREDTPLSELPFRCTIEYYSVYVFSYGGSVIDRSLTIRFLLGIPILIAVVVWQCKRRNLHISEDDGNIASV